MEFYGCEWRLVALAANFFGGAVVTVFDFRAIIPNDR